MSPFDQDLLGGVAPNELTFLGDLTKRHFGVRSELRELVDQLDADTEVIIILKRPSDHSVCFKTFGGIDARDANYMLDKTKQRILS